MSLKTTKPTSPSANISGLQQSKDPNTTCGSDSDNATPIAKRSVKKSRAESLYKHKHSYAFKLRVERGARV
ncbi:hypothetical protein M422DRAFT_275008 [Sphaerobolus stellatus SS14]|uniref:Uncharacterized protein n=1 Tax=Sphaerobolus stellatus (strain SS14) TaxID=990650 RepID=A0A0C9U573_SPHS4|nr:hypothetical protein M422DRAFT_275008 [Sphaerobolus stellatus SS14]